MLYAKAVRNVLGIEIDEDWSSYQNVTDSGILQEILDRNETRFRDFLDYEGVRAELGLSPHGHPQD